MDDIPPEPFHRAVTRLSHIFCRLHPTQYYELLWQFLTAVKNGAHPWNVRLKSMSAIDMHEVGCILYYVESPGKSLRNLRRALFSSAAEMGHDPSTISLARDLVVSEMYGRVESMARLEARFESIVKQQPDPNALVVLGELQFAQENFGCAANTLQRALRRGPAGFEWKPACQMLLARIYLKTGDKEKARNLLIPLAESGMRAAEVELAEMLRAEGSKDAGQALYSGGIRGHAYMFQHLAEMKLKEAESARDAGTREECRRWATEWARLRDPQHKS